MAKGGGMVLGNTPRKQNVIGNLRHRITIEVPTYVDDGQGGSTTTWSTFVGPVWALITPTAAKERFFAEQVQIQRTHKIQTRYFVGLTQEMRVNFQGRYFMIKGVRYIDERHFWVEIDATEGQAS